MKPCSSLLDWSVASQYGNSRTDTPMLSRLQTKLITSDLSLIQLSSPWPKREISLQDKIDLIRTSLLLRVIFCDLKSFPNTVISTSFTHHRVGRYLKLWYPPTRIENYVTLGDYTSCLSLYSLQKGLGYPADLKLWWNNHNNNKSFSIWIQTSMMKIPIRALVLYKNAWHHALRAPETYISLQSLIKTVPSSQKDLRQ